MTEPIEPRLVTDRARIEMVQEKLGRPVLALLELPMEPTEQRIVEALNLQDGDVIGFLDIGRPDLATAFGPHTWSCSVSVPPDCSIDVDG